jgi:hypothetical protein
MDGSRPPTKVVGDVQHPAKISAVMAVSNMKTALLIRYVALFCLPDFIFVGQF